MVFERIVFWLRGGVLASTLSGWFDWQNPLLVSYLTDTALSISDLHNPYQVLLTSSVSHGTECILDIIGPRLVSSFILFA